MFGTQPMAGRVMPVCCALVWWMTSGVAFGQTDAPLNSRELSRAFSEAHGAGDYDRAIEIGLKWTRLKTKDDGAAYNLACAYALHGDKAEALKWLVKSVERGWDQPGHMLRDTDLESLRGEALFQEVVGRARERQKPRLEHARTSEPLVLLPPGLDESKPAPLIIAMHGYGGNVHSFSRMWKDVAADAGAILAVAKAVRGVNVSGFGWGDVAESEAIIQGTLRQVMNKHNIDSDRIVLTGFSQGGRMSFALAAKMPSTFCGVIPVAGLFVADDSIPPSGGGKYYIMVGGDDRTRTVDSNRAARKALEAAGLDVELVVYPDLGHSFPDNREAELKKALAFVLGD